MKKYPAPRDAIVPIGMITGTAKRLAELKIPEREIRAAWSKNYQRMKKREKMKMRDVQIIYVTGMRRTGN